MTVKKCDRCGFVYDMYGEECDGSNVNAMMLMNLDNRGKYFEQRKIELCPVCRDALLRFLDCFKEE